MSEDKEEKDKIQDALNPLMYGFILGVFVVIMRHLFQEETCGYFC